MTDAKAARTLWAERLYGLAQILMRVFEFGRAARWWERKQGVK